MPNRQTNTEIINELRMRVGLNADGTRNGNGLLGKVDSLEKENGATKKDIDSINKNIIFITVDIQKRSEENIKIADDIKEIKKSLNDKIGMSSISNLHKMLICIGAIGGVISFIISISSKLL